MIYVVLALVVVIVIMIFLSAYYFKFEMDNIKSELWDIKSAYYRGRIAERSKFIELTLKQSELISEDNIKILKQLDSIEQTVNNFQQQSKHY